MANVNVRTFGLLGKDYDPLVEVNGRQHLPVGGCSRPVCVGPDLLFVVAPKVNEFRRKNASYKKEEQKS